MTSTCMHNLEACRKSIDGFNELNSLYAENLKNCQKKLGENMGECRVSNNGTRNILIGVIIFLVFLIILCFISGCLLGMYSEKTKKKTKEE